MSSSSTPSPTTTTTTTTTTTPKKASSYKRAKLTDTGRSSTTSTDTTLSTLLPNSTKLIATHSGTFQADEALGVWLLRQTAAYRNSPLIRTRDPKVYSTADIVLDVGGVYDHDRKMYDHHQREYGERFAPTKRIRAGGVEEEEERCTELSASGLIYRHYGREVVRNNYPGLSHDDLELVYTRMYDNFLETIDAIDTGVEMVTGPPGARLVYGDSTGLSCCVGRLNPRWNEIDDNDPNGGPPDITKRFEEASALCGAAFTNLLVPLVESTLPARAIVEKAVVERYALDASGEIALFPNGGLPWRTHLYDIEKEQGLSDEEGGGSSSAPLVKFVLYTDQAGMWRVQAVTVEGQAFENRLSLPQEWRGVRDGDLTEIAGIAGCKFCHAAGFIGGNETFEGALEMARVALSRR